MKAVTALDRKELEKIVAYLPGKEGDGWWKSDGDAFLKCGMRLLAAGMNLPEVEILLQAMFNQARSEYGG